MFPSLGFSAVSRGGSSLRSRSSKILMSRGRPRRSFSTTTTATATATATATISVTPVAASNGPSGGGSFTAEGNRRWQFAALAGIAAAAAAGGVAVACSAPDASLTPPAPVPAAESSGSGPSAVAKDQEERGKEEEEDNAALVAAAHELRLGLTPPHQSLFRVVCILIYEDYSGRMHRITGTNTESSTIGGSICAERAAMCKLREARDCKRVMKVVVVTDNPTPLAPGILCREFLSAHLASDTPVIMSGAAASGDGSSSSSVLGGLLYDEELDKLPAGDVLSSSEDSGSVGGNGTSGGGGGGGGGGLIAISTCSCGIAATSAAAAPGGVPNPLAADAGSKLLTIPDGGGVIGKGDGTGVDPLAADAGSKLLTTPDGGGVIGKGDGTGVDVCTVGDLYPWSNMYGMTSRGELLRLGFLRQQVAEELSKPGLAETLGFETGVLEAYDAAWRATAEDKRDGVHPIRYAAVALFSDGEAEVAHQLKALEYGATLDPVTLLAPAMMRRAKDGIRPSWIIVCDQFGLMHAPFAQARTFLSEHGFGETKVVLHADDGQVVVVKAKDLVPRVTTSR